MVTGELQRRIWVDERRNGRENHSLIISGLSADECQEIKKIITKRRISNLSAPKEIHSSLGFIVRGVKKESKKFLLSCGFTELQSVSKKEEILFLRLKEAKGPLRLALSGVEDSHKASATIVFLSRHALIEMIDTTIQHKIFRI